MCLPVCESDGRELVQHLCVGRRVGGADDVPDDADLVRRVGDEPRVGQVPQRRGTPLAGAVVERVRAGAVERQVHVRTVAADVVSGVAARQEHVARRRRQGLLDQPRRDAHAAGLCVHGGAGFGKERLRAGVGEGHPDLGEHAQAGLVDGLDLVRRGRRDARDHGPSSPR